MKQIIKEVGFDDKTIGSDSNLSSTKKDLLKTVKFNNASSYFQSTDHSYFTGIQKKEYYCTRIFKKGQFQ